jgi:mitofilin
MDSQVNFERELRHQLSRQAAAHSDHLADVLKVQESQLEAKFTVQLEEHLTKERLNFQTEVAGWIARLKGIETAVEGINMC